MIRAKKEKKESIREDEIKLLRGGEIADARVGDIGGLVSRHHIVPYTHFLV